MKRCNSCGQTQTDEAFFCTNCGRSLSTTTDSQVPLRPAISKGKPLGLFILLGIAVVMLVLRFLPRAPAHVVAPAGAPVDPIVPSAYVADREPVTIPLGTAAPSADRERVEYSPLTFHGYECTDDCSGHEAGYQWAEDNDIDDPDDCGGNSQSFIEGCQAYAEEQQEEEGTDDSEGSDEASTE